MSNDSHPAAETIAAFAEGRLARADVAPVMAHMARCADCRAALEAANEAVAVEGAPMAVPQRRMPWWIGVAAAAAVLAIVLVLVAPWREKSGVARLAALAPADRRLVEPQLSAGFAWAPYRGPVRAEGGTDARAMKIGGVAAELADRADRDPSAGAQHDAGVAMLLAEKDDDAVRRLREATAKAPGDAAAWSDLAAAQYTAAVRSERPSLLPEALAAADRAVRIDPRRAEALFNRALILERLGLGGNAREAWQRYLDVDGTSAWAAEARARLGKLPKETGESQFKREAPRLEAGVDVARIVAAFPQQSRTWAEGLWLGEWGEAVARGDPSTAARKLAAARTTGDALVALSNERLLRDAVAAIEASKDALAAAHADYYAARLAYARARPQEAEPRFRRAADAFAKAGSPMSLVARYFAACARFDRQDVAGARRELETLRGELSPAYPALAAQVEWELGLCWMTAGDWDAALPPLERAAATFRRLGERSNAAFVETLLADTLASAGRPDASWAARVRSFAVQSAEGRGTRLPVSLGAASRIDLRIGRPEAARALLRLEQTACRATGNDALVADALLREAVLAAKLGDRDGATRAADEATAAAKSIADPALRERALADVDFATGAIAIDPRTSRELLTRAIAAYREHELPFYLAEALLLRARAARALGDAESAARDLDDGLRLEPAAGTGVYDTHDALYDEAIELALDRGEVPRAFAYAERRAGGSGEVPKLTETAVLEIVAMPKGVVVFAVDREGLAVHRGPLGDEYDSLIRPFEQVVARNRRLVIIPDRRLGTIEFAALSDRATGKHLIEKTAVAIAEHVGADVRPARTGTRVLTVALPTAGNVALPDGLAEVRELRGVYGGTIELAADGATFPAFLAAAREADVIHLAGHTRRTPGEGDPALLFAGRRVTWSAIAEARFERAPVVVLGACETLRTPAVRAHRTRSLGSAFLAAGARAVVGTLAPIPDGDARALFAELHRHLAAGADAATALRETQLRAIATDPAGAWRHLAVLTNSL